METLLLNGSWNGSCILPDGREDFSFSGTVPGCAHTDLMGDRIPGDIFYRDNTESCQWIEDRNWRYTRTFQLDRVPENVWLVFEGLDTYAEVTLNGIHLGSADNMFISHRFDVSKALQKGENTLSVYFRSPVREVAGKEPRTGAFTCERMHTRRIQCTYGWDWVARFVTCGIWRDVYLQWSSGFGVKNAYIYTEQIQGDLAQIVVEAETEGYEAGGFLDLTVKDPEGRPVFRHRYFCREPEWKGYIDIPNARLWYPSGYGEQPLYTLEINGTEWIFGIRTAVIEQRPDEEGSAYYEKCLELKKSVSGEIYDRNTAFSGFRLLINGIPILCKGANWVPSEPFPSAETEEKITTLLTLAKEAGVNMLRVWGGGIFECSHFYGECDRLGILTTQDFLMACGSYPEEEEAFLSQLRKEAEYAAYRLRNHPSLVWWSGDNENAVRGWDGAENYQGRTAIHRGILPVLTKLDPRRRFLLSSPYGGELYASKTVGTTHNTQYMGESIFPYIFEGDPADYKAHFATYLARFIAEEPTLGAICLPSLRRFMTREDIFDSDEMWNYHMKGNPGLPFTLFDLLKTFTEKILGAFTDGADRYFKLKYIQYEWVRITLENTRRNRGFINGMIYWMWNDCWPASAGWSFVDYYCLPKASFYSFKRCAGAQMVSVDKTDRYDIYVCNDGLEEKPVRLSISCLRDGQLLPIAQWDGVAPGQTGAKVYSLPLSALPEGGMLICDVSFPDGQDRAFYKEGTLPMVPCAAPDVVEQTENSITLRANGYIHAVELEGMFVFADNYFSLLPGEQRTIRFRPAENGQPDALAVAAYTVKQ